ncbi:MAG: alpha/beta hydrolase fold domain-containing protein [Burkholderiales bacterium]
MIFRSIAAVLSAAVIGWLPVQGFTQTGEIDVRRDVEYVVHGGQSLKGDLYTPRRDGRFPVVVAIHGGGWQLGGPIAYQFWGPWLAARGIAVYAISYRFSKPDQKSFPEALQDVRAAIQFLKGRGTELRIDPARIAVMGDSAGGHLAALVALAGEHPAFKDGNKGDPFGHLTSEVKAAIPVYGVFDMVEQWRHDQLTRSRDHIVEKFLGTSLIDNRRAYFDASPLSYVASSNNRVSFMVTWGTHDDIVAPAMQSERFLEALKQARYFARPAIVHGAPHFWMSDPIEEPGSHAGWLAPRLLRFLQARL